MTKTALLQAKMKEHNYTIKTLSKQIGLSCTGLFNKIHNKKEFVVSEIQLISKALDLNDREMKAIFFTQNVECNSTDIPND
jgi:cyanate lyase